MHMKKMRILLLLALLAGCRCDCPDTSSGKLSSLVSETHSNKSPYWYGWRYGKLHYIMWDTLNHRFKCYFEDSYSLEVISHGLVSLHHSDTLKSIPYKIDKDIVPGTPWNGFHQFKIEDHKALYVKIDWANVSIPKEKPVIIFENGDSIPRKNIITDLENQIITLKIDGNQNDAQLYQKKLKNYKKIKEIRWI